MLGGMDERHQRESEKHVDEWGYYDLAVWHSLADRHLSNFYSTSHPETTVKISGQITQQPREEKQKLDFQYGHQMVFILDIGSEHV